MTSSRSWLAGGAAVLAVLLVLGAVEVLGRRTADRGAAQPQAAPAAPAVAGAAPGWRWESYGGVEVQVPPTWTYGISDTPWCAAGPGDGSQQDGEVGRPGPLPGVLCVRPVPADKRGQHVWLSSAVARRDDRTGAGTYQLGAGWVRDVVQLAGVRIDLQTKDLAVRTRILGSVRRAAVDVYRCPATHPITAPRLVRPARGAAWDARVTGVSICRFDGPGRLHGSSRLAGAAAQRVLDTIEAAPPGGGPDDPASYVPGLGRGTVLRFDTAAGVREVFVRYDGSRHNGFDNGAGERRLTREALTFMSGPLVVNAGLMATMTLLPRR